MSAKHSCLFEHRAVALASLVGFRQAAGTMNTEELLAEPEQTQ